jgi:4-hydroxybenzoate polyprenyltransferase
MSIRKVFNSFILCARSRPVIIFVYTWPSLITFLIASNGASVNIINAVKLIVAVTFVAFSVYFYNDLTDIEDDLTNRDLGNPKPANRPFGKGTVSEAQFKRVIVLTGVIGLLAASSINLQVLALQTSYIILGYLYSTEPFRLKRRFLMKQPTITAAGILVNLSGAMAAGGMTPPVYYMLLLHMLMSMGLNPIVDIRDMRGDRVMGVKSIPVVWGPQLTLRLYFVTFFVIIGATFLGYSSLGFTTALPILITMVLGSLAYVSRPLLTRWDDPVFLNVLIFKRLIPLVLLLQLTPLVGLMIT